MTKASDYLESIKKYGRAWYDSYAGKSRGGLKQTIVICPTTYPNVLQQDTSMYDRRHMFNTVTQEAAAFYRTRGMDVIITGPEGLGAGGIDMGLVINYLLRTGTVIFAWVQSHKVALTLVKSAIPAAKHIKSRLTQIGNDRLLKAVRQTKPRINLDISLYVDVGRESPDLVPYAQQMFQSVKELNDVMQSKIGYIHVRLACSVIDTRADSWIYVTPEDDYSNRAMRKIMHRISAVSPHTSRTIITSKGWRA